MASSAAPANEEAWKESTNPVDHCEVVAKKTNTTDYKCKHCNHTFSGTKTRCYVHLTGDGSGVRKCSKCPVEVQRALKAAKAQNQGKSNLKRKAEEDLQEQRRSSHLVALLSSMQMHHICFRVKVHTNYSIILIVKTSEIYVSFRGHRPAGCISDAAATWRPSANVQERTRGTYRTPQPAYNVQRTAYNVRDVQRTEHPWLSLTL